MKQILVRSLSALGRLARELTSEAALATLVTTVVLVTRHALGQSDAGQQLLAPLWHALARLAPALGEPVVQNQLLAFALQLGLPFLAIYGLHRTQLADYGLDIGDAKFWGPMALLIAVIQLVVVFGVLVRDPAYQARYPSLPQAHDGGLPFWLWEASRAAYMLSWEFLFRGYLLFALERRVGLLSVPLQMVPFALMHIVSGKPPSEVFFTIGSGVLSGVLALEARSVWPLVLLHALGAVLLDVGLVYLK